MAVDSSVCKSKLTLGVATRCHSDVLAVHRLDTGVGVACATQLFLMHSRWTQLSRLPEAPGARLHEMRHAAGKDLSALTLFMSVCLQRLTLRQLLSSTAA